MLALPCCAWGICGCSSANLRGDVNMDNALQVKILGQRHATMPDLRLRLRLSSMLTAKASRSEARLQARHRVNSRTHVGAKQTVAIAAQRLFTRYAVSAVTLAVNMQIQ